MSQIGQNPVISRWFGQFQDAFYSKILASLLNKLWQHHFRTSASHLALNFESTPETRLDSCILIYFGFFTSEKVSTFEFKGRIDQVMLISCSVSSN